MKCPDVLITAMKEYIHPKQQVLICLVDPLLTQAVSKAVTELDATAVIYGADLRWRTLIIDAFANRVTAVIGDGTLVLGLAKLARAYGMPLKVRTAILTGGACGQWLCEGIARGMDCNVIPATVVTDHREAAVQDLEREMLHWSSVLDCTVRKGDHGLELEIVSFAGEKTPRIPSCARLVMRPWEPDGDIPMILTENH